MAMMCSALLAARSPPRLSRCLTVFPDDAGTGLAPHRDAKLASDRNLTPHFMIADADEPAAIEAGGAHFIVRRGSNRSRRESGERVEVAEEKGPETGAKAKFNQAPHSARLRPRSS